jgi:hypothetical protein
MPQFETYAASVKAHGAPLARGLWCWPALMAAAALLLDAFWPLLPNTRVHAVLWLDLAALGCLAWTFTGPRRARSADWATAVDGRVLSGFVLSVLHVVHLAGAEEPVLWLHQIAAAGVCFYTLSAKLRRDARAPDAVWPAFALIVLVLSGHALLNATAGLTSLAAESRRVDVQWASHYGLAKTLLIATLLCAGRACESSARALWRVTALIGALVCGLLLLVGGPGLALSSLASLDEPFYFGMSIVAFLLLAGMARMAWDLARERPEEAGRWRAAALMFPLVAALLLFGGMTGGEGVRLIVALAGAAVTAARIAPRATLAQPAPVTAMLQPAVRAA